MGKYDSRFTRVKPIFNEISLKNNWFDELFKYSLNKFKQDIPYYGKIIEKYWGDTEKTIKSPDEYLNWIICNVDKLKKNSYDYNTTKDDESSNLRKKLFNNDIDTFRKAKYSIINKKYDSWCIFEGDTHYDVFIETENIFFIVEGKRTEPSRTKDTSWSIERDQMIRNIDCLFSYNPLKPIYAFYILEEKDNKLLNNWEIELKYYENIDNFRKSLPHRSYIEVEIIKKSFIGYLTWNELINLFEIDKNKIPDTYEAANSY